ncbi:MAG TPA: leucyl aminopeptidase, partial [Planctomycetota bacterium]|nr:leucyl aminopeptidase [Planctomycetota bacterium]
MNFHVADSKSKLAKTDLLVVFHFERAKPELPSGTQVHATALGDLRGEFRDVRLADALAGPAKRVLFVGVGKSGDLTPERLRRVAAIAVQRGDVANAQVATLWCDGELARAVGGEEAAGVALAEGALMGGYRYTRFKSKPRARKLASVTLAGPGKAFRDGARHGRILAEANLFARDLQNAPGNVVTPSHLADSARALAKRSPRISAKVHDTKALRALELGALLAVSQGSEEPPRLVHLAYRPKGKSKGTIALVGKGVTFDAGGISIKPASKMWDMKYDMSGAAAVLGVFHALAELDLPLEIHGVVPATENLPDGRAIKPGDVVTAMNGTTIEVLNTDAEGRLILCDAICYAKAKIEPDTLVDLATLTGAVVVALGHELSGLFASTTRLEQELRHAGDAVFERLWPLPLLDVHTDQMKGEVADLKNIHGEGAGNGAS